MNIMGMTFPHPTGPPKKKKNNQKNVAPFPHLIAADSTYRKVLCKVVWLL